MRFVNRGDSDIAIILNGEHCGWDWGKSEKLLLTDEILDMALRERIGRGKENRLARFKCLLPFLECGPATNTSKPDQLFATSSWHQPTFQLIATLQNTRKFSG